MIQTLDSISQDDLHSTHEPLIMNGAANTTDNKDDDMEDNPNNLTNLHSSANSTTWNVSCRSSLLSTTGYHAKKPPQPLHQPVNRRRAFFHDDVIVPNENVNRRHSSITDENQQILTTMNNNDDSILEENSGTLSTHHNNNEENQPNKPFKRKVVSFSTMPFEKKVADGR